MYLRQFVQTKEAQCLKISTMSHQSFEVITVQTILKQYFFCLYIANFLKYYQKIAKIATVVSKVDSWKKNQNIFTLKIDEARFARKVVKREFLKEFSNNVKGGYLHKNICLFVICLTGVFRESSNILPVEFFRNIVPSTSTKRMSLAARSEEASVVKPQAGKEQKIESACTYTKLKNFSWETIQDVKSDDI